MHIKDAVRPLFPKVSNKQFGLLLQFYCHTQRVAGWVLLIQHGLNSLHAVTWVDEGSAAHMGGSEGLSGEVGDPVT